MPARGTILLVLVLCVATAGCEMESWLQARHVRTFREMDAGEARRLVAERRGVLVQAVESVGVVGQVVTARLVPARGPVPPALAGDPGSLVVLADRADTARRLAARLVRAGASRVAVVQGGVAAWREQAQAPAGSTARF
jgi:hypothetical protein